MALPFVPRRAVDTVDPEDRVLPEIGVLDQFAEVSGKNRISVDVDHPVGTLQMSQPEIDCKGLVERRAVLGEVGAEDRPDAIAFADSKRGLVTVACHDHPIVKMRLVGRNHMLEKISVIPANGHGFETAHESALPGSSSLPARRSEDMGRNT